MRRPAVSLGVRRVLMATLLLLLANGAGWGQAGTVAPSILQSVVLHPCGPAETCGDVAITARSVIPQARSSGSMSGRLAPTRGLGSTAYLRDAAVSVRVQERFVRSLERRLRGEQAEAIARNLRNNDPVARWAGMVSGDGLRTGDLADALASYWVLNWAMANGSEGRPEQMLAVRDQVRWAVATQPALARLTDAEKQAMAEEAMLNFVYEVTGYLQARQAGNEAVLGRIAAGAEVRFRREMAVDLRSLLLTSKGLEAKR